jgi:hypothetical protein
MHLRMYACRMYLWVLLGYDPLGGPIVCGAASDLAKAMRAATEAMSDPRGFLAIIEEVRPRMTAAGLQESFAPTGLAWQGRHTTSGGVRWDLKRDRSAPTEIYQIPESPVNVPSPVP